MIEFIKSILYGIVEGITEWLPVSSTGHLILTQGLWPFGNEISKGVSESGNFTDMFNYVIQLGAIFAVIVLFWKKLWPFKMPDKGAKVLSIDTGIFKKDQWSLWFKVILATIPSVAALPIDEKIEEVMYKNGQPRDIGLIVISIALVVYGIGFIVVEKLNKNRAFKVITTADITYKTALLIGLFQVLAVVPGTSRSGATIIGALIIGVSRPAASEFSFFMAIPTMVGVSALKIVKFLSESSFTPEQLGVLAVGMVVSFLVSMLCIKKLMQYVKKHDFAVFGYYRIVVGIAVLLYFALR